MGENIPGGDFLGGKFPGGGGDFPSEVWWVGIFPGGIFLEPYWPSKISVVLQKTQMYSWNLNEETNLNFSLINHLRDLLFSKIYLFS